MEIVDPETPDTVGKESVTLAALTHCTRSSGATRRTNRRIGLADENLSGTQNRNGDVTSVGGGDLAILVHVTNQINRYKTD